MGGGRWGHHSEFGIMGVECHGTAPRDVIPACYMLKRLVDFLQCRAARDLCGLPSMCPTVAADGINAIKLLALVVSYTVYFRRFIVLTHISTRPSLASLAGKPLMASTALSA